MGRSIGAAKGWRAMASQMRWPTTAASKADAIGHTTENSSPPTRPMATSRPNSAFRQSTTAWITASPAGWPKSSLTCLKWSMSSTISATSPCSRQRDACSMTAPRLSAPVSGSWVALYSSWPASSCSWRLSWFISRSARSLRRIRRRVSRIRRSQCAISSPSTRRVASAPASASSCVALARASAALSAANKSGSGSACSVGSLACIIISVADDRMVVEIERAEIVVQLLAEFEDGVVVLVVVPVQAHRVAGQGGVVERLEQREQHLGAGAVEVGQRDVDGDVYPVAAGQVGAHLLDHRAVKGGRVFRIRLALDRQRVVVEAEVDFGRGGRSVDEVWFHVVSSLQIMALMQNTVVCGSPVSFTNSNSSGSLASRAMVRKPRPAPLLSSGVSSRSAFLYALLISSMVIVCSGSRRARIFSTFSVDTGLAHSRKKLSPRMPMQKEPRRIWLSRSSGVSVSDE